MYGMGGAETPTIEREMKADNMYGYLLTVTFKNSTTTDSNECVA